MNNSTKILIATLAVMVVNLILTITTIAIRLLSQ